MNFDHFDIGLAEYSLLSEGSSAQVIEEIYTPIQAYRFSMVLDASLETLNVRKSNLLDEFKLSELFMSSAYACSYAEPLLINDIESITISIAATSNENYQIGQDITNEFMVLSSHKNILPRATLAQWNENKKYGARQNYRNSIKLAALAFADPKSMPEGSYTFAIEVKLNDNMIFKLESASVFIDPFDNGESAVKYRDVYKKLDTLLCAETEEVNGILNSGEISQFASEASVSRPYLSQFILQSFAIEPILNTRCAILPEPEVDGNCGSILDHIVVHTIPEQYVLSAQSIGYRPTSDVSDHYTEVLCHLLNQDADNE